MTSAGLFDCFLPRCPLQDPKPGLKLSLGLEAVLKPAGARPRRPESAEWLHGDDRERARGLAAPGVLELKGGSCLWAPYPAVSWAPASLS